MHGSRRPTRKGIVKGATIHLASHGREMSSLRLSAMVLSSAGFIAEVLDSELISWR